ncbi:MAG: HAD-IIIA family hydrolase [Lentisphaerae bacterium]|nr:HAD-IIIA family hydrolase [Lentisphaerota bacterium]
MIKCVFFDRDGIVNQSPGPGKYVLAWEEFRLQPEFPTCLRLAQARGYAAAIVTNQRAVARGLLSAAELAEIHQRLRTLLQSEHQLALLDIIACPHADGECTCRKPQPGMLLTLAQRHAINLSQSWMIGDAERDIEAGRRAGCRTIRVGGAGEQTHADFIVTSMADLPAPLATLL